MNRRLLMLSLSAVAALAACSGPYFIAADVNSYGAWPTDRKPSSFAFDRLPSQQQSKRQAELEEGARAALEKAGFKPAADPRTADVLVTLGARVSSAERAPWDDPLWWRWHGGYGYWRNVGFYGGPWRLPSEMMFDRRFEREVALVLRDRQTNTPLYEARASNDGSTMGDANLMSALFSAALSDFPRTQPQSHRVTVQATR